MTNEKVQCGRFDYVKYDATAVETQELFKNAIEEITADIDFQLTSPRAKALALTKLEEAYMWIGKAIRDDQVARNGIVELNETRAQ